MPRRAPSLLPGLVLALALPACAPDDTRGSGSSFSGGQSGLTSASGGSSSSGASDSDSDASAGASSSADASSGADASTGATSATTAATGGNPDGLPNGSTCTADAECMSDKCYENPLPVQGLPSGVCSVCKHDSDCVDAGLGISCTISAMDYQAVCTDGSAGSFCESQAACKDGLWCQILVEGAEGLLPMSCGTCRTDADCDGGRRCTPSLDLVTYTGHKYCALPQSLKNDELCPLVDGDPLCLSGHCEIADLGGLLDVAVCGQCSADSDCPMGQTCKPGTWSDGPVGSLCG